MEDKKKLNEQQAGEENGGVVAGGPNGSVTVPCPYLAVGHVSRRQGCPSRGGI